MKLVARANAESIAPLLFPCRAAVFGSPGRKSRRDLAAGNAELLERECVAQLLGGPLDGRVRGHVEVKNTATIMSQHQKHVQDPESDCGHREEIDGDELREVVVQESAPGLRRWLAPAHHVLGDTALADVDAELE